jgi:hypothetical protein
MPVLERAKHILAELRGHAPFTLLGASLGIAFMLVFRHIGAAGSHTLFAVFHPTHVVLSAMVTASMFKLHSAKKHLLLILLIGYFGSVGIATVSDIIIPHFGSKVLGLDIPTHAELHQLAHASENGDPHGHAADEYGHSDHHIHFGFIDEWYIVNPAALLGIFIAVFLPRTKFPHSAHVLVSTWASSAYLLMNLEAELTIAALLGAFVVLFLAVWLPCCFSDIVFPLLFVKSDLELAGSCLHHGRHSHPHIETGPQEATQ